MRRLSAVLCAAALCAASIQADPRRVDPKTYLEHVKFLASEDLEASRAAWEARETGTREAE